jgi:N4-gp56 family major capsid protein
MATTTETTATLSNAVKTYYVMVLLERLQALYLHGKFADEGQTITLPKGKGKVAEFRRYEALAPALTPLTEGLTPDGINQAITLVTAQPDQYGSYVQFSDLISTVDIDPFITTLMKNFGEQAGNTLDQICRNILHAGTNVQYAGAAGSRAAVAAGNKLTTDELNLAVRTLKNGNAPKIPDSFGGSYVMVIAPNSGYDIFNDTKFQAAANYAGAMQLHDGELGRWNGIRILETSNGKFFAGAGAGGINVYSSLVFGQHWYGKTRFDDADSGGETMMSDPGMSDNGPDDNNGMGDMEPVQIYVKPVGSSGSADPLNQRGTAGWKASHKAVITNQACGLRIEHATS